MMMVKAHVPSEKKMKDRFENPGDRSNYCSKDPEEKSNEASNQTYHQTKQPTTQANG